MAEFFSDADAMAKIQQASSTPAAEEASKEIKNFDEAKWKEVFCVACDFTWLWYKYFRWKCTHGKRDSGWSSNRSAGSKTFWLRVAISILPLPIRTKCFYFFTIFKCSTAFSFHFRSLVLDGERIAKSPTSLFSGMVKTKVVDSSWSCARSLTWIIHTLALSNNRWIFSLSILFTLLRV